MRSKSNAEQQLVSDPVPAWDSTVPDDEEVTEPYIVGIEQWRQLGLCTVEASTLTTKTVSQRSPAKSQA